MKELINTLPQNVLNNISIGKNNIIQTGATDEQNIVFDTNVTCISWNFHTMFSW